MKRANWIEAYRTHSDPTYVFYDGSDPIYKLKTRRLSEVWEKAKELAGNYQSINLLVASESKPVPEVAEYAASGLWKEDLLKLARKECQASKGWRDNTGAREYTKKFEPVFGKGRFPWCAAFVTWCLEKTGIPVPIEMPSRFGYTSALVEAWQQWAIEKGFYLDNQIGLEPVRGDIVLFDWNQPSVDHPDNDWEDHIGFYSHTENGLLVCFEGNYRDRTAIVHRSPHLVQGYIRLPSKFSF